MTEEANSVDNTVEDVQSTNPQEDIKGTQETDNSINTTVENVASTIDYQKKFSESSSEANRLYEENKKLREELELIDNEEEETQPQNADSFYPGFDDLDEEAKSNLIAYTDTVTRRAKEEIYKDPAIAFAKKQYNERTWDIAFEKAAKEHPELAEIKDEFKNKYYNVNNVPVNIDDILMDVAKIALFDKAKGIGAKEESEKSSRTELERTTAGTKDPTVKRSLEDWNRMATENPTEFRKLSKEFNEALTSGEI